MTYTIHANKVNKNADKSKIAAKYAGVSLNFKELEMGKDNKSPEFLKLNPNGKVCPIAGMSKRC